MAREKKKEAAKYDKAGELNFEVSTGLKRVLGRELITNEEVAIFELVKNSFDAQADRVDIHFSDDAIWVIDNGTGMSYEDLNNKWLFVAYSSKRQSTDFRDHVADRRHYAGSKGIGRFSSDRLGAEVVLQTRPKNRTHDGIYQVIIDWDKFDKDDLKHFDTIPVEYSAKMAFDLPDGTSELESGTAIEIRKTRIKWKREAILKLKASLAKLINPFGAEVDGFKIFIHAPDELEADDKACTRAEDRGEQPLPKDIVNGEVGNFIFSALQEKTTFIKMFIDEASNSIETTLVDRGEQIYRIRENNPYPKLTTSGFRCELYYLNTSAKQTFARRVGLPSVKFGSVFLFRNGFRVYPIGEDSDDWFGISRRKQQGYARFLGTREVIGRIDVEGDDQDFQEASSRNQGLIENQAVREIQKCFREHCLKRLEKYVVPVSWPDKADRDSDDLTRLLTDPGKARITEALASLVDNKDIDLLDYSHKLVGLISERSDKFESSLVSLRRIAEKTKDKSLFDSIEKAEQRFEELKKTEAEARRVAEEERKAKEAAQKRAVRAEEEATTAKADLEEEKKRTHFLQSVSTLDHDTILNMHHQITIYTVDMELQLENFIAETEGKDGISRAEILSALEPISLLNKKIKTVSKFATKANFRLESEAIDTNMADYIMGYIEKVARDFAPPGLSIEVANSHPGLARTFKPIDISIVIDNFISNAKKARATSIRFELSQPKNRKGILEMTVRDNGKGISERIDVERLFEKGFTTTDGAGLGLYHVKQVLGEMKGSIRYLPENKEETVFLVEVTQ